jgi:hypothetical protein
MAVFALRTLIAATLACTFIAVLPGSTADAGVLGGPKVSNWTPVEPGAHDLTSFTVYEGGSRASAFVEARCSNRFSSETDAATHCCRRLVKDKEGRWLSNESFPVRGGEGGLGCSCALVNTDDGQTCKVWRKEPILLACQATLNEKNGPRLARVSSDSASATCSLDWNQKQTSRVIIDAWNVTDMPVEIRLSTN